LVKDCKAYILPLSLREILKLPDIEELSFTGDNVVSLCRCRSEVSFASGGIKWPKKKTRLSNPSSLAKDKIRANQP
jgi:hypothetical protein